MHEPAPLPAGLFAGRTVDVSVIQVGPRLPIAGVRAEDLIDEDALVIERHVPARFASLGMTMPPSPDVRFLDAWKRKALWSGRYFYKP